MHRRNVRLEYSRSEVKKAGKIIVEGSDSELQDFIWAFNVVSNWRACHSYPLNTFQATLRSKVKNIDTDAIVAERLKRFPSIRSKLQRIPGMSLARMQDIGGLRAVVRDIKTLKSLHENYRATNFKHELANERDYVEAPKKSGYRSIHLVYKYKNINNPDYDGLFIELQLRTKIQHAWATAVETMGFFLKSSLKASEGPEELLDFFSLASAALAHFENTNPLPAYRDLERQEVYALASERQRELKIIEKLSAYSMALRIMESQPQSGSYYLIVLNPATGQLKYSRFGMDRLTEAADRYQETEREYENTEGAQVVLVSTRSFESLKRAYPNYFLDTGEFVKLLKRIEKRAK